MGLKLCPSQQKLKSQRAGQNGNRLLCHETPPAVVAFPQAKKAGDIFLQLPFSSASFQKTNPNDHQFIPNESDFASLLSFFRAEKNIKDREADALQPPSFADQSLMSLKSSLNDAAQKGNAQKVLEDFNALAKTAVVRARFSDFRQHIAELEQELSQKKLNLGNVTVQLSTATQACGDEFKKESLSDLYAELQVSKLRQREAHIPQLKQQEASLRADIASLEARLENLKQRHHDEALLAVTTVVDEAKKIWGSPSLSEEDQKLFHDILPDAKSFLSDAFVPSEIYASLGLAFEEAGEKVQAQTLYGEASERARDVATKKFYKLNQIRLDPPEVAVQQINELKELAHSLKQLEPLAVSFAQSEKEAQTFQSLINQHQRAMASASSDEERSEISRSFQEEHGNFLRHFLAQHQVIDPHTFAELQAEDSNPLLDKPLDPQIAGYFPQSIAPEVYNPEKRITDPDIAGSLPPGDLEKVRVTRALADHLFHRAQMGHPAIKVFQHRKIQNDLEKRIQDRLSAGDLAYDEALVLLQHAVSVFEYNSSRYGAIESAFLKSDGDVKEVNALREKDKHFLATAENLASRFSDDKAVAHLVQEMHWQYEVEGRFAYHHYEDAIHKGVTAVSKVFPHSDYIEAKIEHLKQEVPSQFSDGVIVGNEITRSEKAKVLAERELALVQLHGDAWRRFGIDAGAAIIGGGLGCSVGSALGGALGFGSPAPGGTAGGSTLGCTIGTAIGGASGSIVANELNALYSEKAYQDTLRAAATVGMTVVTQAEMADLASQKKSAVFWNGLAGGFLWAKVGAGLTELGDLAFTGMRNRIVRAGGLGGVMQAAEQKLAAALGLDMAATRVGRFFQSRGLAVGRNLQPAGWPTTLAMAAVPPSGQGMGSIVDAVMAGAGSVSKEALQKEGLVPPSSGFREYFSRWSRAFLRNAKDSLWRGEINAEEKLAITALRTRASRALLEGKNVRSSLLKTRAELKRLYIRYSPPVFFFGGTGTLAYDWMSDGELSAPGAIAGSVGLGGPAWKLAVGLRRQGNAVYVAFKMAWEYGAQLEQGVPILHPDGKRLFFDLFLDSPLRAITNIQTDGLVRVNGALADPFLRGSTRALNHVPGGGWANRNVFSALTSERWKGILWNPAHTKATLLHPAGKFFPKYTNLGKLYQLAFFVVPIGGTSYLMSEAQEGDFVNTLLPRLSDYALGAFWIFPHIKVPRGLDTREAEFFGRLANTPARLFWNEFAPKYIQETPAYAVATTFAAHHDENNTDYQKEQDLAFSASTTLSPFSALIDDSGRVGKDNLYRMDPKGRASMIATNLSLLEGGENHDYSETFMAHVAVDERVAFRDAVDGYLNIVEWRLRERENKNAKNPAFLAETILLDAESLAAFIASTEAMQKVEKANSNELLSDSDLLFAEMLKVLERSPDASDTVLALEQFGEYFERAKEKKEKDYWAALPPYLRERILLAERAQNLLKKYESVFQKVQSQFVREGDHLIWKAER